MASMGIGAYRFSVSWPRIQPDGRAPANPRGLDHYRRVVDELRRHDIVPTLTLYHWDLPQALEDAGGWPVRETAERFADYAATVARSLGDSVPMWITINEPMVAAWLGYEQGVHAPGRTDEGAALAATHHLLLAHGLATEAIRAETTGEVGIALNLYPCRPAGVHPDDARAATLADDQLNRLYLDPVFGRPYPGSVMDRYAPALDLAVRDADLTTISAPIDFLGVNYYTVHTVTADPDATGRGSELPRSLGVRSITPADVEVTAMGWPIQPDGLTEILTRVGREYGPPRLYVTENGAAFDDIATSEGGFKDVRRIDYLERHVAAAHDAIVAGAPLAGYFVWSLLDNFEWSEGYSKRFGLVHVDFSSQERTPKESARWYTGLISARR